MSVRWLNPYSIPVLVFVAAIFFGTVALRLPICGTGVPLSWLDAMFTATSATCVTGLIVVDTGNFFSPWGQGVILLLIQLGGLGIMTYSSLVFYLWRRKVSFSDRVAVGQSLLHDPGFHLGLFLLKMVILCFTIEAGGALLLHLLDPEGFRGFSALFHSVSAFCNAGFGLKADSLVSWNNRPAIMLVFMVLIILGGLGFSVLVELTDAARGHRRGPGGRGLGLSWYSTVVLWTTLSLILAGGVWIAFCESLDTDNPFSLFGTVLNAFFQSVTCRTAGFNSVDLTQMTNSSLVVMVLLMFIGGSPGSCSGGIKTTTFRALIAFGYAQFIRRKQAVIGRFALDDGTMNKVIVLVMLSVMLVGCAVLALTLTESVHQHRLEVRGQFLDIVFETVSAFGTVGLSLGLTSKLSVGGKIIVMLLMFVGRLGPVLFLTMLQRFQSEKRIAWPQEAMLVG